MNATPDPNINASLEADSIPKLPPDEFLRSAFQSMRLSRHDAASNISIKSSGLTAQGWKGYRSIRGSHGISFGTMYFEALIHEPRVAPEEISKSYSKLRRVRNFSSIDPHFENFPGYVRDIPDQLLSKNALFPPDSAKAPADIKVVLGDYGHVRLGFSTTQSEINGPTGSDQFSFGYRDVAGSKVHRSMVEPYGEPYGPGDVIGCLIHIPPKPNDLVFAHLNERAELNNIHFLHNYAPPPEDGIIQPTIVETDFYYDVSNKISASVETNDVDMILYDLHKKQSILAIQPNSFVEFFKNGVSQGIAFADIQGGTYYPTVSLFYHAAVTVNFGPDFAYPPLPYCQKTRIPVPLSEPDVLTRDFIFGRAKYIDKHYSLLFTPILNLPSPQKKNRRKTTTQKRPRSKPGTSLTAATKSPIMGLGISPSGGITRVSSPIASELMDRFPKAATTAYNLLLMPYITTCIGTILHQTFIHYLQERNEPLRLAHPFLKEPLQGPFVKESADNHIFHDIMNSTNDTHLELDPNTSAIAESPHLPYPRPKTKLVERHRLVFFPKFIKNPKQSEIGDDVLVPFDTICDFPTYSDLSYNEKMIANAIAGSLLQTDNLRLRLCEFQSEFERSIRQYGVDHYIKQQAASPSPSTSLVHPSSYDAGSESALPTQIQSDFQSGIQSNTQPTAQRDVQMTLQQHAPQMTAQHTTEMPTQSSELL